MTPPPQRGCNLLEVEGLVTGVQTEAGMVRAVDGVTLQVGAGEAVALVGESGCGKSMTALSLMRLVRAPVRILEGRVFLDGEDLLALPDAAMRRLRGGRMAMIFQDPMTFLNPLMTVGQQIAEAVSVHQSLGRAAARAVALDALRQVRLATSGAVMDRYPHQLSGGMRQRVLIALAISSRPALLIADEPTTALDVTVQAQVMRLLAEVRQALGSAMLLITHDLGLVAEHCDRVLVMYAGHIVEQGGVEDVFRAPRHPYTRALLRAALPMDRRVEAFAGIEGQPPDLLHPPTGCRYFPRCTEALARCAGEPPPMVAIAPGVLSRCWLEAGHGVA